MAAACAAGLLCLALFAATPANAFELFGIQLWGDSADDAGGDTPDPTPYETTLTVNGAQELKDTLSDASILIADEDRPPSGMVGLVARARTDQKRLVAALYGEGYYGGTVAITLNGQRLEDVPFGAERPADPVAVAVTVDTGPVFQFGNVTIAPLPEKAEIETELTPGATAGSNLILEAEQEAVRAWRAAGHPLAKVGRRQVQANHASNTLNVSVTLEPGPQAVFGAVRVSGAEAVREDVIVSRAHIPRGTPYHPDYLADAESRLQELGVFNAISVTTGESVGPDGTIPVLIEVSERKPRTIGFGVTASNTEGLGTEAYWVHRNLLGGAESLRLEGEIARIGETFEPLDLDYRAAVIFAKPEAFGPATRFTTKLEGEQENPDAYLRRALQGEAFASRSFTREISARLGVEGELAHVRDAGDTNTHLLFGIPAELVFDSRDDKLSPSEGVHASLFAEPVHGIYSGTTFFTTKASIASYAALTDSRRVVLAGRLAAGSIFGADVGDIPANRRFYAGGGGSIRGYAFQAASPRDARGDLVGGLSFVETSLEARIRVTDTIGVVPFIDIGGAFASEMPGTDGDWYTGVGLGLRYLTPVGPLRLDAAVPLKDIDGEPDFGLYLGVGQAF